MKTTTTLIAGISLLGAAAAADSPQYREVAKPWEVSLGGVFWAGDHEEMGFDAGFLVGLDYHLTKTESMMGFLGLRAFFGDGDAGLESRTWGAHYGVKMNLGGTRTQQPLYFKVAAGLYNTDLSDGIDDDEWGIGGFASIGYDFSTGGPGPGNTPFSIEAGYFLMPKVASVDNHGLFAAFGIRF